MYFLSEEEKRLVLRRLLPQSRSQDVHPDLRGWSWHQPPLSPIYDVKLGIYEIAGKYCPTSRDVYWRRVEGIQRPPNRAMLEGGVLHNTLVSLVLSWKRTIYNHGNDCLANLKALSQPDLSLPEGMETPHEGSELLREKIETLWQFEHHRILSRVQEILARQPYIGPDSLVALALPITVEQRLDGSLLGLSSHLSADAFLFSEPMMVDIKFGEPKTFHRLTTTGYALVMESIYEFPINLGCVVYATFQKQQLRIERDFHFIDDELRQWLIEERDERMRMVEEEIDPRLAQECYNTCPYWRVCYPD